MKAQANISVLTLILPQSLHTYLTDIHFTDPNPTPPHSPTYSE